MNICVFCSSSDAVEDAYGDAAADLGRALAEAGHALVYGGTDVGLMGIVAHAAREAGGEVIGIVPRLFVDRGIEDREADELVVTDGMMARKQAMVERSDAFVALPGGFGTLDEILEMLTLKQLGFHRKPVVFAEVQRFWEPLLGLFERLYDLRFAKPDYRLLYHVASTSAEVLRHVEEHDEGELPTKWY